MQKFLALVIVCGLCVPAVAQEKKGTPEEQFAKLDANSDKKLSKEEFVGKRTGDKATKAETQFAKLDKNSDGAVDLEEFKARAKKKAE